MLTINNILKEMKDVPANRLEELYQFVHSLTPSIKQVKGNEKTRKKILSYGGAFSDMSSKDYSEFVNQTKKVRSKLFDRSSEL